MHRTHIHKFTHIFCVSTMLHILIVLKIGLLSKCVLLIRKKHTAFSLKQTGNTEKKQQARKTANPSFLIYHSSSNLKEKSKLNTAVNTCALSKFNK